MQPKAGAIPSRAGLVTTLIACYNHIRLWCNGLHHCKSKRRVCPGLPAHAALPTHSLRALHGSREGIVLSSPPSPRCRGSVARVEDQDRLAGVWRRLWCAEEADVRCRMNPVRADHTGTQRPPSSATSEAAQAALTRRLEGSASERASQAKGKYRGFIVGSLMAYYSGRR
jgi:hypothetical protein